jgi:hypothetical protein
MPDNALPVPWDKLNLPELLAGPAGKAISRLIGAAVEIPAAALERISQGIKDKTDAKSLMTKALAAAAADRATSDPALVERAAHSFLSKQLRAQANKEAIARLTIDHLNEEPPPTCSEEIDDDWLNLFERYAEDASTERLQDMWARVLARQIRTPRSFSLKTLRFVAELDTEIASIFDKWSNAIVNGGIIPGPLPTGGEALNELFQLQDFGLITGVASFGLAHNIEVPTSGTAALSYRNHALIIFADPGTTVSIPSVLLTRVGREIAGILAPTDDIERAKAIVDILTKQNVRRIAYGPIVRTSDDTRVLHAQTLWDRPAEPATG